MSSKASESTQEVQTGSETIRPRPAKRPSKGKYELCSMFPNCRRGEKCTYAHSEAEMMAWNNIRPMPNIEPYGGAYEMCSYLPDCEKGEACTFAHSEEERRTWSQLLKKKLNIRERPKGATPRSGYTLCPLLPNCPTGGECAYAHSDEEKYAWTKELAGDTTDMPKYVKLSEFANNPNQKVKRIVLNETVEDLLTEHLIANKMKLGTQFTEEHVDDAFNGAHYDYSEAEVECSDIDESPPVLEYIGEPYNAINGEDKPSEEAYHKEVEYTEGLELSKTKSSGWNITGGLSAEYQGVGASGTIGYHRNQSKTVTKIKSKTLRQIITKTVIVPPKHKRSVAIVHRYQRKGCKMRNIKVTFPKNAKFECKVDDYQDHRRPKINNKYTPNLGDLLNKHIIETGASTFTARLEGKYVWVESNVEVDVSDPQPITE